MEQIIFVVLVAIVALLRFLMQLAEKKRNQEAAKRVRSAPQVNAPVQRAPADSEEERVQKFFEALGVPAPNAPPPKAAPRRVVPKTPREPKRTIMPVDPFPVPRLKIPRQEESAPPSLPPVVPVLPAAPQPIVTTQPREQRSKPVFEVTELVWGEEDAAPLISTSTPPEQTWAARLGTAENLRDAIVLREIFGPPRGLQLSGLTTSER